MAGGVKTKLKSWLGERKAKKGAKATDSSAADATTTAAASTALIEAKTAADISVQVQAVPTTPEPTDVTPAAAPSDRIFDAQQHQQQHQQTPAATVPPAQHGAAATAASGLNVLVREVQRDANPSLNQREAVLTPVEVKQLSLPVAADQSVNSVAVQENDEINPTEAVVPSIKESPAVPVAAQPKATPSAPKDIAPSTIAEANAILARLGPAPVTSRAGVQTKNVPAQDQSSAAGATDAPPTTVPLTGPDVAQSESSRVSRHSGIFSSIARKTVRHVTKPNNAAPVPISPPKPPSPTPEERAAAAAARTRRINQFTNRLRTEDDRIQRPLTLPNLPSRIITLIIRHLDYPSAAFLKITSRSLNRAINLHKLPSPTRNQTLLVLRTFSPTRRFFGDRDLPYLCTECLMWHSFKHMVIFPEHRTENSFPSYEAFVAGGSRTCVRAAIRQGRWRLGEYIAKNIKLCRHCKTPCKNDRCSWNCAKCTWCTGRHAFGKYCKPCVDLEEELLDLVAGRRSISTSASAGASASATRSNYSSSSSPSYGGYSSYGSSSNSESQIDYYAMAYGSSSLNYSNGRLPRRTTRPSASLMSSTSSYTPTFNNLFPKPSQPPKTCGKCLGVLGYCHGSQEMCRCGDRRDMGWN